MGIIIRPAGIGNERVKGIPKSIKKRSPRNAVKLKGTLIFIQPWKDCKGVDFEWKCRIVFHMT